VCSPGGVFFEKRGENGEGGGREGRGFFRAIVDAGEEPAGEAESFSALWRGGGRGVLTEGVDLLLPLGNGARRGAHGGSEELFAEGRRARAMAFAVRRRLIDESARLFVRVGRRMASTSSSGGVSLVDRFSSPEAGTFLVSCSPTSPLFHSECYARTTSAVNRRTGGLGEANLSNWPNAVAGGLDRGGVAASHRKKRGGEGHVLPTRSGLRPFENLASEKASVIVAGARGLVCRWVLSPGDGETLFFALVLERRPSGAAVDASCAALRLF